VGRKSTPSDNPIRRLRLERGMTLEQFADECNIHLQAVYLNEMGMYPTILPSIMEIMRAYGFSGKESEEEYQDYVKDNRFNFGEKHSPYNLGTPDISVSSIKPFRTSLGYSTAFGFAKAICINPTIIRRVEFGKVLEFPGQLNFALRDIQMDPSDIQELELRHQEFYGRSRFWNRQETREN
jgi:DNA-binding XRE family transcriptional regulator